MATLITVYAPAESDLADLAGALQAEDVEFGLTRAPSSGDLYLDPNLVDVEMWKLIAALAGGAASGVGKALLSWSLTKMRSRKATEPPIVVKIGSQKIVLNSSADCQRLRDVLAELTPEPKKDHGG